MFSLYYLSLIICLSFNILISSPQQTGSCLGVSLGTPSATLGQSWRPGAPCHSSRSSSMRRPPSRPYLAIKQSWADTRASNEGSRRFHNHRKCPYYGFQPGDILSRGLLRDCEIFANLRITFVSSSILYTLSAANLVQLS